MSRTIRWWGDVLCCSLPPLCSIWFHSFASWYMTVYITQLDAARLVTLWKQYEFRPHFSAIRLMCNYFFKRAILLYLIPVFIYYSSTEEIFVIYDGYARIVLFPNEIYFSWIAFPLWNSKYIPHTYTYIYEMRGCEMN